MANTSGCTDAGAALTPLLSGRTRVRHCVQCTQRLWSGTWRLKLTLYNRYRLVLTYHAKQLATDSIQQIPNDPPQVGAKSTTTGNHPSIPSYHIIMTTMNKPFNVNHYCLNYDRLNYFIGIFKSTFCTYYSNISYTLSFVQYLQSQEVICMWTTDGLSTISLQALERGCSQQELSRKSKSTDIHPASSEHSSIHEDMSRGPYSSLPPRMCLEVSETVKYMRPRDSFHQES